MIVVDSIPSPWYPSSCSSDSSHRVIFLLGMMLAYFSTSKSRGGVNLIPSAAQRRRWFEIVISGLIIPTYLLFPSSWQCRDVVRLSQSNIYSFMWIFVWAPQSNIQLHGHGKSLVVRASESHLGFGLVGYWLPVRSSMARDNFLRHTPIWFRPFDYFGLFCCGLYSSWLFRWIPPGGLP